MTRHASKGMRTKDAPKERFFARWIFASASLGMLIFAQSIYGYCENPSQNLHELYSNCCRTPSDINEHLPSLRKLANECASVVEFGLRDMNSTVGILMGLSENSSIFRSYIGVDCSDPSWERFILLQKIANNIHISFNFVKIDDVYFNLQDVDMAFIDTLHNYIHLTYELERFSPKVHKYIAMHDTSEPYGDCDEIPGLNESKYFPWSFDPNKKGLWSAVEDFLSRHPEWSLYERRFNNHGFTILKRVD